MTHLHPFSAGFISRPVSPTSQPHLFFTSSQSLPSPIKAARARSMINEKKKPLPVSIPISFSPSVSPSPSDWSTATAHSASSSGRSPSSRLRGSPRPDTQSQPHYIPNPSISPSSASSANRYRQHKLERKRLFKINSSKSTTELRLKKAGLSTVQEEASSGDEMSQTNSHTNTPSPVYLLPSAMASSQALSPSPVREHVSSDEMDIDGGRRRSSCDSDNTVDPQLELTTPQTEDEDPFNYDSLWETVSRSINTANQPRLFPSAPLLSSVLEPYAPGPCKTHRPPPLDLSSSALRSRASSGATTAAGLLSPMPILSPGVYKARKNGQSTTANRKSQSVNVNLESALGELLASCGFEQDPDSSDDNWSPDSFSSSPKRVLDYSTMPLPPVPHASQRDLTVMMSFPLPPARPTRLHDMGLGAHPSPAYGPSQQDVAYDVDTSPSVASPNLVTPTTPLNNTWAASSGGLGGLNIDLGGHRLESSFPSCSWRSTTLESNHSFLQSLSRGEDPLPSAYPQAGRSIRTLSSSSGLQTPTSPYSSNGSLLSGRTGSSKSSRSSSSGRLPKRATLPEVWKNSKV